MSACTFPASSVSHSSELSSELLSEDTLSTNATSAPTSASSEGQVSIPVPTLRRQVSTLQFRHGYYGRKFLRMAHQPRVQQLVTRIAIGMNMLIVMAATISLVILSRTEEMNIILCAYISVMTVRSILNMIIHTHCLLVPDMYINRHSSSNPATTMHKVQRATRIVMRIVSAIMVVAGVVWMFLELEDMDAAISLLAIAWVGLDLFIVLGEIAIYVVMIRVISYKVVSLLAPYLPISKHSLIMFQCEEQQSQQEAQKRAGLDKKELKVLKQSQHAYDASTINSECAICLLDFELDEKINTLSCRHSYHSECISQWLSQRGTCPLCVTRAEPLIITSTTRESSKSCDSVSHCSHLSTDDIELSIVVQ